MTVRAVDDSDVDDTTLPTPRLTTTSGVNFSANSAWEPTGQNDGTQYRAIFTVPQGQPSGNYYVETLFFTDIFGNFAQGYSNSENRYLEVVGAEGNPPVLSDPAITPSNVNVIYEEQNVTLSITATDDSELMFLDYQCQGSLRIHWLNFYRCVAMVFVFRDKYKMVSIRCCNYSSGSPSGNYYLTQAHTFMIFMVTRLTYLAPMSLTASLFVEM